MPITHAKVSAIADTAASGLVQPSDWNASHVVAGSLGTPGADGIAFPAVQVPSAGANVLDDYEEGTYTPTLTFDTPGDLVVAYSLQLGTYTKVGRLVVAHAAIACSTFTHTTAVGALRIGGLPFTVASSSFGTLPAGVFEGRVAVAVTNWLGYVISAIPGTTYGVVRVPRTTAAATQATKDNFTTAIDPGIRASFAYYV